MGEPRQEPKKTRARRLLTITPAPVPLPWLAQVAALKGLRSPLAMEFWRILRRVHGWADTPQESRGDIFDLDQRKVLEGLGRACAYPPRLVETFGAFARLVRTPGETTPEAVSHACHEVMQWASEEGYPELVVLFAEAAAAASPMNADHANVAGKACRTTSKSSRAETWYHRGIGVAIRTKNRQAVIDALLGYGNLRRDLGRHEDARPYFERAAQRALNTGRLRQAGKAHHDLLTIAAEVGTLPQARRHVTLALDYYPAADARLPALAHDWAYLLVRLGHYSSAIPLLTLARQYAPSPDEETVMASTLAWSWGGIRDRRQFDEAEAVVTRLLETHRFFAAAALIHLARGARAFGQWERAESYAREACQIARQRKEETNVHAAVELLRQIRAREMAPMDTDLPDSERIVRITRRFQSRLRRLPTPGHHRPGAEVPAEEDDVAAPAGT